MGFTHMYTTQAQLLCYRVSPYWILLKSLWVYLESFKLSCKKHIFLRPTSGNSPDESRDAQWF